MSTLDYDDLFQSERLLRPGEVASLFRVNSKTVTRWANTGRIPSIRTLGGHHRFRPNDIRRVYDDSFS